MQVNRRGQSLILTLAVLLVLSTMGVSFVSLATMEKKAVGNMSAEVQTRLVVQAGLDYAVAQLYECFRTDIWYGNIEKNSDIIAPLWYYGGEDINGNGLRDLLGGEADVDRDGTLDCPLDIALAPSFRRGGQRRSDLCSAGG